jgi:hypothetical protein
VDFGDNIVDDVVERIVEDVAGLTSLAEGSGFAMAPASHMDLPALQWSPREASFPVLLIRSLRPFCRGSCYESTTTRLRIESPRPCVSGDAPDVQNSADPDDTKYQNLYCKKDIPLPGSSLHIFVLPEGATVS